MENEPNILLKKRINEMSKLSYKDLKLAIGNNIAEEITGSSGMEYQISIHCFYDDKKKGTIRVLGAIFPVKESGPWWKFWGKIDKAAANNDFIMNPDGTLSDEKITPVHTA